MLLWRQHPNGGNYAAVSLPRSDYRRLRRRGWLKINGHRADVLDVLDEEYGDRVAFRIKFDHPYPYPHP